MKKFENHDSLIVWITDTALIKTDTLKTKINYWGTNKKGDTVWISDTLNFRFTAKENVPKKPKKQRPDSMLLTWPLGFSIDLNINPYIETQFPITTINSNKIRLLQKVDTVDVPVKFEITRDTLNIRKAIIKSKWTEQSNYKLTIPPGTFENIYGLRHDSLKINFITPKIDFYGKLIINLTGMKTPVIVQLLDNDKPVYEKYAVKDGDLVFDYLQPKMYTLKAIIDSNGDKKWTPGDFLKHKQPERVLYYKENVNVRSNWDFSIAWDLK